MGDRDEKHCANCIYFNGDDKETQEQFCDDREWYVFADFYCTRWKERIDDE